MLPISLVVVRYPRSTQVQIAEQFLVRKLAGRLRCNEARDQVAVWRESGAALQVRLVVSKDPQRRLQPRVRHLEHTLIAMHDRIGPAAQHVLVLARHAEQPAQHRHRQSGREVADDVDATGGEVWCQQLACHAANRVLERRHGRAREQPVRQMAQSRMHGRVAVDQQRQLPLERLERRSLGARVNTVVAGRSEAVRIARQRPETIAFVQVGRRLVAQTPVGRVRVVVVCVVERVVEFGARRALQPAAGRAQRSFSMTFGRRPTGRISTRSSEQSGA